MFECWNRDQAREIDLATYRTLAIAVVLIAGIATQARADNPADSSR